MLNLMIADGAEEIRQALESQFRDRCLVKTCADGEAALELLQHFVPDVLVIDLMLPKTDGLTVMQVLRERQLKTMVLAQTSIDSPYIMDWMRRLDAAYVMRKPCNLPALEAHIRDFLALLEETRPQMPHADQIVAGFLLSLGFSAKLDGYGYLLDALPIYAKDPAQAITKELYVAVGNLRNKEPTLVERSIRSAIDKAWRERDDSVWRQYFHCAPDGTVLRPSNGTFIARVNLAISSLLQKQHIA
jgi:two-component system response regulator (stage 0 sporulation protein A)